MLIINQQAKNIFILLFLLTIRFSLYAQKVGFENMLIKHKDWRETPDTRWDLSISEASGSLYYYGAIHADDPSHSQFRIIREKWEEFKPTLVFYEGPDRGIAETDTLTIRKFGESGYVRYLAAMRHIPTKSLEPPIKDLYEYLVKKTTQPEVDLYMLSKEAMRLRTRKGLAKEALADAIRTMMAQVENMLGRKLSLRSLDELSSSFEQYLGREFSWWEAPESWYNPQDQAMRITNRLAVLSTEYRDIYMVKKLSESILKGEKVFAVVGRNHVPLQVKALTYAISQ